MERFINNADDATTLADAALLLSGSEAARRSAAKRISSRPSAMAFLCRRALDEIYQSIDLFFGGGEYVISGELACAMRTAATSSPCLSYLASDEPSSFSFGAHFQLTLPRSGEELLQTITQCENNIQAVRNLGIAPDIQDRLDV